MAGCRGRARRSQRDRHQRGAPAVTGIDDKINAIDDRVFLREMIAAGVGEAVGAIGVHPYGAANPPDERAADDVHLRSSYNSHPSFFFLDTLEDYHAILREANIEKPLWVTEFGWPSIENFGEVDTSGWDYARDVTESDQAAYLLRALQLRRERPWVGPLIIWNLNMAPLFGAERSESALWLRPDGSKRPAYQQVMPGRGVSGKPDLERRIQQIVEDPIERSDPEDRWPSAANTVGARGKVIGEPDTVGVGHHSILRSLPDGDGSHIAHIEPPVARECEIVVPLSGYAMRQPGATRFQHPLGEVTGHLSLVNLG
jgi:hypothetical protein